MSDVFVGRQGVLDDLGAMIDDAFAGRGGLVMVAGELGIGKTAVAREFASRARQRGVIVLSGGCFEGGWQPAYAPWVEALGAFAAAVDRGRLSRLVREYGAPLTHLVPALRAALPGTPPAAPLSADEERFRLYDAVSRLLAAIAEEAPVLLVLDDLQWADRDTLRLLRYVARVTTRLPLLILGAYRDADPGDPAERLATELLADLQHGADVVRIRIRGLSADEVDEYLAAVAGTPVPQGLAPAIHEETAGNPFYVREVLHQLVEEGKLVGGAEWSADFSLRDLGVPPGVREILVSRMARLPAEAQQVLRMSCALSGGFEFPLLRALTGLSEAALLDSIDALLGAGLFRTVGERRPGYDFAHAIVRHTLIDELNPDRRARLHRRIAQALEAMPGPALAAELAYQYHASRALPGAEAGIAHCRAAAAEAAVASAPARAARFLRMSVDLADDVAPGERADLLSALAVAEAEALQLEDSRESAEAALVSLAADGAGALATAAFLARVSRTLKDGGASRSGWEPLVERGLELLGERRDLTWARLTLLLDRFEPVSTGLVNASRWAGLDPRAIAIAREEGDEDDYARTLEPLEWRTREQTERVLALARRWQRPAAVIRALDVAARDQLHWHGTFRAARETLEELLAASERYGSIPAQAESLVQMSAAHAALGDLASAREAEARARELVGRLGPQHRLHLILDLVVGSLLAYFDDGAWLDLGRRAAHLSADREAGHGPFGPVWASLAAVNLSRAGRETECRRLLDAVTPVLDRLDTTASRQGACVCRAGDAVWELAAIEHASSYRRLALDLIAAGVGDPPIGSRALTVARMTSLLGDEVDACAWFARARSELEADGRRPLRAIVDYDEALALIRAGTREPPRIGALLDRAVAAFRSLGMSHWERRALRALPRAPASLPDHLTDREAEVLGLLAAGRTNKEIAAALVLSPATVERHVANLYRKIGVHRRAEAATYAVSHGLLYTPAR